MKQTCRHAKRTCQHIKLTRRHAKRTCQHIKLTRRHAKKQQRQNKKYIIREHTKLTCQRERTNVLNVSTFYRL